jgi:glutamate synthase domain-containing protein 3
VLTFLYDTPLGTGSKKRSSVIQIAREALYSVLGAVPSVGDAGDSRYRYIGWRSRALLQVPAGAGSILVVDAKGFPPEGDDCDARLISQAYRLGWRRFICYNYSGQRYCGCGLAGGSVGVRIDVYGSSGDYLASGADGLEIHVHGSAQDQLGQIMASGKLVIYGDVGQTFMYGAKGGEVYVMGNAAGRPLINAVGKPRVVINGTCLDYLGESFMAGDPLKGGGFVILNGVEFDGQGMVIGKTTPYPGSNLFSLASGGAIYLRDPYRRVAAEQLNGGEFVELKAADWDLIAPYLRENQQLFDISVEDDLLTVDGVKRHYRDVYRKVRPIKSEALKRVEMEREEDETAACRLG